MELRTKLHHDQILRYRNARHRFGFHDVWSNGDHCYFLSCDSSCVRKLTKHVIKSMKRHFSTTMLGIQWYLHHISSGDSNENVKSKPHTSLHFLVPWPSFLHDYSNNKSWKGAQKLTNSGKTCQTLSFLPLGSPISTQRRVLRTMYNVIWWFHVSLMC